jgi:predicted MFS family arabinose efflux permease
LTELKSVVFGLNAGRISSRFGRTLPAAAGAGLVMVSAACWIIAAPAHPSYLTGSLPGLLVGGVSVGLVQAPLLTAAGTLPPDRATTGSAVLSMARQIGSAIGGGHRGGHPRYRGPALDG